MSSTSLSFLFFFNYTPPPEIYTLSLHDALPIYAIRGIPGSPLARGRPWRPDRGVIDSESLEYSPLSRHTGVDRKSTRLNSSHITISYAVFCLKKKKKKYNQNLNKYNINRARTI